MDEYLEPVKFDELSRISEHSKLRGAITISPFEQTIDATGMMRIIISRKVRSADIFFSGRAEPIKCHSDQFALVVKDGDKFISSNTIMPTAVLDYNVWNSDNGEYILSLDFQCIKVDDITWQTGIPIDIVPIVTYKTAMLAKCNIAVTPDNFNQVVDFIKSKYHNITYLSDSYFLQDVLKVSVPYHFKIGETVVHGDNIQLGLVYSTTPVKVAFDCDAVYKIYNEIKNQL